MAEYTSQELLQGIQAARAANDVEAVQWLRQKAIEATQAEDRARYDPTKGMSGGQKFMANLGAGASNIIQGGKQLAGDWLGLGPGVSDEEIEDKRARDRQLAESQFGGSVTQFAGEVLPAVATGMGGAGLLRTAAARGFPGAARATQAINAVPSAARTAAGAAGGAALIPVTEDESRLQNVALAGTVGAVAPWAVRGAAKGARGLSRAAGRTLAPIAAGLPMVGDTVAGKVGSGRVGRLLEKELADVPSATAPAPKYIPNAMVGTKASAAIAHQDPKLASLELASRGMAPEQWQGFDVANKAARWQHLDESLQGRADLDKLVEQADEIGAKVPYGKAKKRAFATSVDDMFQKLQVAKETPQYAANPTVRSAVDYLDNIMSSQTVTPELLHQAQQTLKKGLTGAPGAGEAGVRAATSEPFVISMVNAIDDVLEQGTKGKWSKWKQDYSGKMVEAEGAKADINIRNKFQNEATGTVRSPVPGEMTDIPNLTSSGLRQAATIAGDIKRGPRKGKSALTKSTARTLQNIEQDLQAQSILQSQKAASVGGLGSDTAPNLARMGALEWSMGTPGLGILLETLGTKGGSKITGEARKQLAELLQDPDKLRQFLLAQQLRGARDVAMPRLTSAAQKAAIPLGYAAGGTMVE